MDRRLSRRAFLREAGAVGAALWGATAIGGCAAKSGERIRFRARPHPMAEAWAGRIGLAQGGDDPARNTRTAIEKVCGPDGLRTFIRPGDVVAVKPNIGWAQVPEMGATVDPAVVAAVVRLARQAGARSVKVFDNSVGTDSKCYEFSGIEKAARQAGAEVRLCAAHRFRTLAFDDPRCKRLKEWPIYEDALAADVLVNIAVAKIHNLSYVTLCMKNLMGGRRDQVAAARMMVCGTSAVTVDAWAADPRNLPWPQGHHDLAAVEHIALGAAAGLGVADPDRIEVAA